MRKSSSAAPKQPSSKRSSNKKARILSRREVYRGPAFSVTTDDVLEPSGIRARRDIVHHTGSIVVLAIDESRERERTAAYYLSASTAMPRALFVGTSRGAH